MVCFITILVTAFLCCTPAAVSAFVCDVTTTPVNFNNYDVFSPVPSDSTGSVSVSCNNPDQNPILVTISISSGGAGIFTPRRMQQATGSDLMCYNLYIDPARTTIWGDGTGSTSTVTANVTKNAMVQEIIYGRVPARQNLSVGAY